MLKCLITRPNHDRVTSYLCSWSKHIIENNDFNEIKFLDLYGEEACKEKVESYLKKQNPRIVLFNGHGSSTEICGFKNETLIMAGKNEELLKGKIIYSLSCSSAKILGEKAVQNGADAFIGYKNPFILCSDSEREATPLKDNLAGSFLNPSNKVSIELLKGKSALEASEKSKEEFKKEIRKYTSSGGVEGAERIAAALVWDMANQVVLGNSKTTA